MQLIAELGNCSFPLSFEVIHMVSGIDVEVIFSCFGGNPLVEIVQIFVFSEGFEKLRILTDVKVDYPYEFTCIVLVHQS